LRTKRLRTEHGEDEQKEGVSHVSDLIASLGRGQGKFCKDTRRFEECRRGPGGPPPAERASLLL
jgi:hypothetical protein